MSPSLHMDKEMWFPESKFYAVFQFCKAVQLPPRLRSTARHTSRDDVGHVTNLFQQVSDINGSDSEHRDQILLIMFQMSGFCEYLQQTGNNSANIRVC